MDSAPGQKFLSESHTKQNYTILTQQFQTQKLRAYCGVASGVIVLNALNPSAQPLNQDTFFTPEAQKIRSAYAVAFMGMSLGQLAALLKTHHVQVETHYASEITLEQFRTQVKENLARNRDFVIVNYDRAGVGQVRGDHISPLSAYDEKSDRFHSLFFTDRPMNLPDKPDGLNKVPQRIAKWTSRTELITLIYNYKSFVRSLLTAKISGLETTLPFPPVQQTRSGSSPEGCVLYADF